MGKKPKTNKIPLNQSVEDIVEQLQDAVDSDKVEEAWNKEITEDITLVGNTHVWKGPPDTRYLNENNEWVKEWVSVDETPSIEELEQVALSPEEVSILVNSGAWTGEDGEIPPQDVIDGTNQDPLYRAMVEDGLIIDASEEILPGVNLDDEWRKYQEEHAAKLPPIDVILKPIEVAEPFVPPVVPEKRQPFINLKPSVRTPGPATVKAIEGVQGHNRPRFYGGR